MVPSSTAHYYLNFDSLELEDESKYDSVRRLANSDRADRNPYFPSKWRIHWWNDFRWEEYNKVNVPSSVFLSCFSALCSRLLF